MNNADKFIKYLKSRVGQWSCSVCGTGSNQPAATFRQVRNLGYQFEETGPNRWSKKEFCPVCNKRRTHYKLLNADPVFVVKKRLIIDTQTRKRIIKLFDKRDAFSGASISSVPEIDHKVPWTRLEKDVDASKMSDAEIKQAFQLLTRDHNLLKDRMCDKCKKHSTRPPFFGISFWYAGNSDYVGSCVGCGWYDGERWRAEINRHIKNFDNAN